MTIYIIASANGSYGADLRVTTHDNRRDAFTYVNQLLLPRGRYFVVGEEHDLPKAGPILVAVGRSVGTESDDRLKVYNAFVKRYQDQPHEVIAPVVTKKEKKTMTDQAAETATAKAPADSAAGQKPAANAKGKSTAAKTAGKAAKPATKKPATTRATGKAPKPVAEFKQVTDGSRRAEILRRMDGTRTTEQIAAELTKHFGGEFPPSLVSSNIFCLHRDIGVGYQHDADGRVKAVYPAKKTLADALKPAGAAKAKAAPKAKAKAAPKAKAKAAAPKAKAKAAPTEAAAATA